MAIGTVDQLIAGLTAGRRIPFLKNSVASQVAGGFASTWLVAGLPGAGATPPTGVGEVPTRTTAGALDHANPTSPALAYVADIDAFLSNNGVVILYDRLVHTSGLDGTVTSAQTVNSAAITRPDANGGDVECWLEWYTATGVTSRTATVSYTNQAGTSGRSGTATLPGSTAASRMIPVALQSGDTGVRSVQSVTLSASTGTAGNFGVTLLRRLAEVGVAATNVAGLVDAMDVGLPRIYDDACLAIVLLCSTTSTGQLGGMLVEAVG